MAREVDEGEQEIAQLLLLARLAVGGSQLTGLLGDFVEDAVGVRIRDLPVTAEKIYRAIKARRFNSARS